MNKNQIVNYPNTEDSSSNYFELSVTPTLVFKLNKNRFYLEKANLKAIELDNRFKKNIGTTLNTLFKHKTQILTNFKMCYKDKNVIEHEIDSEEFLDTENKKYYLTYSFIEPNEIMLQIKDITKSLLNIIQLENTIAELEIQNEIKSTFLVNTSHEIRASLSGILGFTSILKEYLTENEKTDKFVSIIDSNGHLLLKKIDDIIDYSNINSNQLKLTNLKFIDLNNTLKEIFYEHKNSALHLLKQNVKLKLNLPKNSILIKADLIRFKQIFDNLIENALNNTDKGSIEIGYKMDESKSLEFYVKDTGVGIPRKKIDEIFNSFQKFSKNSDTGLGLSIVKGLVELMDGTIDVISKRRTGTTFTLSIPFETRKITIKKESTLKEPIKQVFDFSNKKVLIVEDDLNSYLYVKVILKSTNAKTIHVSDGNTAINKAISEKPDVILMDINMPKMNGIEAMEKIRKMQITTPIIVITAYALDNEKEKCFKAGCNYYLTKPYSKDNLLKVIALVLE